MILTHHIDISEDASLSIQQSVETGKKGIISPVLHSTLMFLEKEKKI
jgi:hypothetical protein